MTKRPPDPLSRRAERMREHLGRLALEREAKFHREDAPDNKKEFTRKQRRILNRLMGVPARAGYKFPGCAPNSKVPPTDDPIEALSRRMISQKMKADFARRRAEKAAKRGEQPAETRPAPSPRKGRAGTLWD